MSEIPKLKGVEWHNPDGLSKEQFEWEKGWRPLSVEEQREAAKLTPEEYGPLDRQQWQNERWEANQENDGCCGNAASYTYRQKSGPPKGGDLPMYSRSCGTWTKEEHCKSMLLCLLVRDLGYRKPPVDGTDPMRHCSAFDYAAEGLDLEAVKAEMERHYQTDIYDKLKTVIFDADWQLESLEYGKSDEEKLSQIKKAREILCKAKREL